MKFVVPAGLLLSICLAFLPLPLNGEGSRMLTILGIAVMLWVSEAIPMPATALLIAVLIVVLGIAPASEVFVTFADPLIFLFIGSFILAEAMRVHKLDRSIAHAVLRNSWVREKAGRMIFIYCSIAFAISMWISNTATTAMLFPISLSIAALFSESERPAVARLVLLMTSFGASIGGMATPVGTPPNVIGIGFLRNLTGETIHFGGWMRFALPVSVLIFLLIYLIMRLSVPSEIFRREVKDLATEEVDSPTRRAQRNVAFAFGVTVILWLLPGFVALAGRQPRWLETHLPESVVALIGALLLFVLPLNWKKREFTLTWKDAQRINWGIILLFGGGIVLGKFLFKTGVAKFLGDSVTALYPFQGEFAYILLFSILAIFISEFTSNTASANLILPICIAVSQSAGLDPYRVAVAATLASSLGFMLPVSTAPNAIVFSSGLIQLKSMIRYGVFLDIIGAVVIAIGVYLLA